MDGIEPQTDAQAKMRRRARRGDGMGRREARKKCDVRFAVGPNSETPDSETTESGSKSSATSHNPPAPPCSAATKSDLLINRHMKMDLTEDRVMIGLPADLYLLTPARLR